MPLKWITIHGRSEKDGQAKISWTVAEQSVSAYSVERSINGADFIGLGSVTSKGSGNNSYFFIDKLAIPGTSFYRIRQTDKNGSHSFSSIIKLSEKEFAKTQIRLFPSIVTSSASLSVSVPIDKTILILIVDNQGKVAGQHMIPVFSGKNILPLHLGHLAKGSYTILLPAEPGNIALRFLRL